MMKRSKLLIPTITAAAIAPAIVCCGTGTSTEEQIINAIIDPTKITTPVEVDNIKTSFTNLKQEDRQKEVIYDLFGGFNNTKLKSGTFVFQKPLTTLWKEEVVSFKTNITKCNLNVDTDNNFTSSFLGYVSFVFTKETKCTYDFSKEITFKNNDYIMLTYDFLNANVSIANSGAIKYSPKIESTITGFYKVKYDGGNQEFMVDAELPDTTNWDVKNSKNWVQK